MSKNNSAITKRPPLTPMGCACGGEPDGACSHCPAPVCEQLICRDACRKDPQNTCEKPCGKTCRDVHEAKHRDPRSESEKREDREKVFLPGLNKLGN